MIMSTDNEGNIYALLPAQMRETLLVRMAPAVFPAPSALPTRTQAAPCIPAGIYRYNTHTNTICTGNKHAIRITVS